MDPTLPQPFPPPPIIIATVPPTTITTATAEVENHIAHVANATPNLAPPLNHSHPPYAEMIYAAITALKERNRSSKRAIAKYIERVNPGLPLTHSSLLTHHLKRLKNSGLLVMVKKSYKLPRSDATSAAASAPLSGPPKGVGRGRGRPPKPKVALHPNLEPNAQPVLVALELVDEPNAQPVAVKRGPSRPWKTGLMEQDGPIKRGRGRPPGPGVGVKPRLTKKTPKPKSVSALLGSSVLKRGRGRPPKAQLKTMIIPFAPHNVPVPNVPRPKGRPKKDAAAPILPVYAVDAWKPKKKSTGWRAGLRREKNAALAMSAVSDTQLIAYVDLKRKLEYIQSKVKEAVSVLKPQITNKSAISAVAAIQELEGLVAMDIITAPLQIESQQPQQLPQPQHLQQLPQPQRLQ